MTAEGGFGYFYGTYDFFLMPMIVSDNPTTETLDFINSIQFFKCMLITQPTKYNSVLLI